MGDDGIQPVGVCNVVGSRFEREVRFSKRDIPAEMTEKCDANKVGGKRKVMKERICKRTKRRREKEDVSEKIHSQRWTLTIVFETKKFGKQLISRIDTISFHHSHRCWTDSRYLCQVSCHRSNEPVCHAGLTDL